MFEYLDQVLDRHEGRTPYERLKTGCFEYEGRPLRLLELQRGVLKPAPWDTVLTLRSTPTSVERGGYDDHLDGSRIKYKLMRPSKVAPAYNEALLNTMHAGLELAFFWGDEPGWYIPEYPVVIEDADDEGVWVSRAKRR